MMKSIVFVTVIFSLFFLAPPEADAQVFRRYVRPAPPPSQSKEIEVKEPVVSHDATETTAVDFQLHDEPSPIEPPLADDEYILYGLFGRNTQGNISGQCTTGQCSPQPSIESQKIPGAAKPTPEGNPIEKAAIETEKATVTPPPAATLPPIIPAATQIVQPIARQGIAGRIQDRVTEWLKLLGSVIFLIVAIVYVGRGTWRWTVYRCGLVKRWFERLFEPAKPKRKTTAKKTTAKKKK